LTEHRRKALEPTVLPIRAIAIDGKTNATLKGKVNRDCQKQSGEGEADRYLYLMVNATLISSAAAVCIDRLAIPASTNDMGVFADEYARLKRVYGRAGLFELLSVDAGFTSEENCRLANDDGKAYWAALKGNQPELHAEAKRVLIPTSLSEAPEAQTHWELDSTRGWIRRRLWRTTELAGWGKWPHLRQVVLIQIVQAPGDPCKHIQGPERILEEHFFVTNLVVGRLDGLQLIALMRAHWRIENNFHGSLDVQWEEDHGLWVRRDKGLPVVGLLRAIAYNLLALMRAVHLRSARARRVSWQSLRDWLRDALLWPAQGQMAADGIDEQEVSLSLA
jgi:predicted transposase YbfD/YdcC